ncbi:MAG: shikimate dehydrogenase [Burkholderiales bacterium]|nr:shikimate dehydrogenase [Burkholderiales bacterium]
MLSGKSKIIAHLGYPTESFKAPLIYNPWFDSKGIDMVVVPLGVKAEDYVPFFERLVRLSNIHGALITMPHKVTTVGLLDEASTAVKIAGSCNAVRVRDGRIIGDMFDGEGFTRGIERKGFRIAGSRGLVLGCGGVGSAIAASLAARGAAGLVLADTNEALARSLAGRIAEHYPRVATSVGSADPAGYDLLVNATPLGMKATDPVPFDVTRIAASTFVGEVVMKQEFTPLLAAARERGCRYQIGTDMLFEQLPAYLEFFGYPGVTVEELRAVAKITY